MKVLIAASLLALVLAVGAEPPRYRQRQAAYAAPAPAPVVEGLDAPYPPSGWKPSGRKFSLPSRQAPVSEYIVPPKEQYGPPPAPPAVYGIPTTEAPTTTEVPTTTELPATTTEEVPTTTEVSTEPPLDNDFDGAGQRSSLAQQPPSGNGVYYVLLPDGRLQRIAYSTSPNSPQFQQLVAAPAPVNAGFLALQYQDVQPIQAPVYAYGSPLVRLLKK